MYEIEKCIQNVRDRPLVRPRSWKDNIKKDREEIGCESAELIHLAQDRAQWQTLVNEVTNIRVTLITYSYKKFLQGNIIT
jgi:hypothetical protein